MYKEDYDATKINLCCNQVSEVWDVTFFKFIYFERESTQEHKQRRGRERERERERENLKQALCCQCRDQCGARTHNHEIMT